jgi:hypothetical protein
MLFCFAVVAEPDATKWPHRRPLAEQEQSGAFGTGSWTDTSPRFGCCWETKIAIWELAENVEASNFFAHCGPPPPVFGSHRGTC